MIKKVLFSAVLFLFIPLYLHGVVGMTNWAKKLKGVQLYGVFFINELPPEYFEDFYNLYTKRLDYDEDNIRFNIHILNLALSYPFRHPSRALCLLKTVDEGKRYKRLLVMDAYFKIMKDYLTLGSLYDKKIIYYFNMPFKKDLKESLGYAKYYYNLAKDYWKKVLYYAGEANKINARVDIDSLEDELYKILHRDKFVDWDYDYTFKLHLKKLEANLKKT